MVKHSNGLVLKIRLSQSFQLWPQLLQKMQAVFHVFLKPQVCSKTLPFGPAARHLVWQTSLFLYSKVARSSSVSDLLRNWRRMAQPPQKDER